MTIECSQGIFEKIPHVNDVEQWYVRHNYCYCLIT